TRRSRRVLVGHDAEGDEERRPEVPREGSVKRMAFRRQLAFVAASVVLAMAPAALAWDTQLIGTGTGIAQSLVTAANGDVIASGLIDEGAQFVVVRLDGTTGVVRWQSLVTNSMFSPSLRPRPATVVTLDGAGDVL